MSENIVGLANGQQMRGDRDFLGHLFSYISLEDRAPVDHPLRPLKLMAHAVLDELSRDFDNLYSKHGRPLIPPEQLLKALVWQCLYTICSERQLVEQKAKPAKICPTEN